MLGHIRVMKILPASRREWLGLFSIPFLTYFVVAPVFYCVWLDRGAGLVGKEWRIYRDTGLPVFSGGYFLCFVGLFVTAVSHLLTKRFRLAFWFGLGAALAFVVAVLLVPPSLK